METVINEIRKQTLTLMTAALAFVAGLVWRDAIMAWLRPILESGDGGAQALTYVAIIVTVVAVVATMILTRFIAPKGPEAEKK